ncbi:endo alpha-1,4 polygalactosaminidase [soil metagenome]
MLSACAISHGAEAWLYQLQNPVPARIATAGFRHAIIDCSGDGSDARAFKKAEIDNLWKAGVVPVCYFSIGEAENYRFYWKKEWLKKRPEWLGRENPDWKGNFEVRYWNTDWRDNVLRPYLEKITAAGFGGVYLDIVDGFEYWGDSDNYKRGRETRLASDPKDEAEAAARMVDLLEWIKATGTTLNKTGKPFLVIAQNGERLLTFDESERFLDAITGLGVESLWYDRKKRLPADNTNVRLALLQQARDAGKTVVVTDYVDDGKGFVGGNATRIRDFLARCEKEKFDHYAARVNQELNIINVIKGVQP